MSKNSIALLIQGPYTGSNYNKIFKNLNQLPGGLRKELQIVIVSYSSDYLRTVKEVEGCKGDNKCKIVSVKDLINPGYFNINRQIRTISLGLREVEGNPFVIKLRNDQCVDFNKLFRILRKLNFLKGDTRRILTTNCYTRPDRKYHPSDMFLCGKKSELVAYYDMPLMEETHMDVVLRLIEYYENTKSDMFSFFECPENILFQNYLRHKGWKILDTRVDSFNAIKTYCYIANSWDINLTWEKKRTPILPSGSIILPYSVVEAAPFPGLPPEKVVCYSRHDFAGEITVKDKFYLLLSKVCFEYGYGNGILSKSRLRGKCIGLAKKMPVGLRRKLKSTFVYKIYQKINSDM